MTVQHFLHVATYKNPACSHAKIVCCDANLACSCVQALPTTVASTIVLYSSAKYFFFIFSSKAIFLLQSQTQSCFTIYDPCFASTALIALTVARHSSISLVESVPIIYTVHIMKVDLSKLWPLYLYSANNHMSHHYSTSIVAVCTNSCCSAVCGILRSGEQTRLYPVSFRISESMVESQNSSPN
jgi:hypothetical protein